MKIIALTIVCWICLLTGCATTQRTKGDFVRTTNFSKLDTFSYKHTLASGMNWRDADRYAVEELSKAVISEALQGRGFEPLEQGADFFVITKWRKAVSNYPTIFQHIDGPREALNDMNRNEYKAVVRYTLIIEIYETSTREMFWRVELPNIFDAIQFTEERVRASLERGIRNFPQHIEKDPNLPMIE